MTDGTHLAFYGIIRLPVRLRDVKTEEVFVVSQIGEDAILGMPFLAAHGWMGRLYNVLTDWDVCSSIRYR